MRSDAFIIQLCLIDQGAEEGVKKKASFAKMKTNVHNIQLSALLTSGFSNFRPHTSLHCPGSHLTFSSALCSHSVVYDSLQAYELHHARLP